MKNTMTTMAGALVVLSCGGEILPDAAEGSLHSARSEVRVMSRNMYVGTDVDAVQEVVDPMLIPFAVAEAWQMLLATKTEERIDAMADEIAEADAHLVGLQEVSLIRTQTPGDLAFGGTAPAESVAYDFLEMLLEALAARGARFRVVASVTNSDVEAPRLDPDFGLTDVRLTDFDAIIARDDVTTSNAVAHNFARTTPQGLFTVVRGYVAVDATVRGRTYRVVNTHLEPVGSDPTVQQDQALELLTALEDEARPIVMTGDFNTDENAASPTYRMFLAAGYRDAWFDRVGADGDPGYTAGHASDLRNETPNLTKHIDIIFTRNMDRSIVRAEIVGDEIEDRTPSGLWPSDHAGVWAWIRPLPQ